MPPRVSLCMIVRDEEANLPGCLESAARLVDEVVVVDTGSKDRTREVAARFGAKLFDFPWVDDFAAARNESLRHATGRWVFWLDADDRLDAENGRRARELFAGLQDELAVYLMRCRSLGDADTGAPTVTIEQARLFPNHPKIRWEYRVHEQILPAVQRLGGPERRVDVTIDHTGYTNAAVRRRKNERCLRLLERDVQDRAGDPAVLLNLGWTLLNLGRPAEAEPVLRRGLQATFYRGNLAGRLYALLGRACYRQGKRREAAEACRAGRALGADHADLLFLEALVLQEMGDLAGAEERYLQLLRGKPGADCLGVEEAGLRGYKARHHLATLYREQRRMEEARALWEAAVAEQPDFSTAWIGLADLYLTEKRQPDLDALLQRLRADPRLSMEADVVKARALVARKEYPAARKLLEATAAREPRTLWPRVALSHALLLEGRDWPAAETALESVLELDPGNTEALSNLDVLRRQQGTKRPAPLLSPPLSKGGQGGSKPSLHTGGVEEVHLPRTPPTPPLKGGEKNAEGVGVGTNQARATTLKGVEKNEMLLGNITLGHKTAPVDVPTLAQVQQLVQSKEFEQAERAGRELLARDPRQPALLCLLGVSALGRDDLPAAADFARRALALDAGTADAHNLLGSVLHRQGKPLEGIVHFEAAIRCRPTHAEAHHNLGNALRALGQHDRAIASLKRAIALEPGRAEAHNHLGVTYAKLDRPKEAAACFREAVRFRPDYGEAFNNLGLSHLAQGLLDEAEACFHDAVRLRPMTPEAHNNLGDVLRQRNRAEDAEACLREALRLRPEFVEAHNNLGLTLVALKKPAEGIASFREAIRLKPDFADAHFNMGVAYIGEGKGEEAEAAMTDALRLNPNSPRAHEIMCGALREQCRVDESVRHGREAVRLKPDSSGAHTVLGLALQFQGRTAEALACHEEAVRLKPDYVDAHVNLSLSLLQAGEYTRAFAEYEWRWQRADASPAPFQKEKPLWDGGPLHGRTILLHTEQGLGDTIQFVRYAPLVKRAGGTVLLATPAARGAILSKCPGIDRVAVKESPLPPFDVHAPLLSLPGILGTTLETIPADVPYIFPDPALIEHWKRELKGERGFRIGIFWQGSTTNKLDRYRSFPLSTFAPVAAIPGVRLVGLQKGSGSDQIARAGFSILDLGTRMDNAGATFLDTAAVMANLDLVIGPDSALAHLAGALGAKVWVPISVAADWRWLTVREDSPWYPTMRLFRQTRLGDWYSVFERIAGELRRRLTGFVPAVLPWVDLFDRIAELEARVGLKDDKQLRAEVNSLLASRGPVTATLTELADELRDVHRARAETSAALREAEGREDFGPAFVELARAVAKQESRREYLKKRIEEAGTVERRPNVE